MLFMARRMGVAARRALLIAMRGLQPVRFALARAGVTLFSWSIRASFAVLPTASPLSFVLPPLGVVSSTRRFVSPTSSLVSIISVALGQPYVRVVIALLGRRLAVALRSSFVLGDGAEEGHFPCSQTFRRGRGFIGPRPCRVD
jgi:hypothetical protein